MLNNSPRPGGSAPADRFMDQLTRLLNKAAAIEREPVDTGDGVLLYTSEIHLLDMAARYPGEGMSSLAARLGITKGAVSQTAKKLGEKGYLERFSEAGDSKTVFLRLTKAGQRAYAWHREYHAAVNRRIAGEFSRLSPDEREQVLAVLFRLEEVFDSCPETRRMVTSALGELK